MYLSDYYEDVVKTAGLVGDDNEVESAIETLKTAGLIEDEDEDEVDEDEEKIAAVEAVCEQFDIDEIPFDDEDEKIAAAIMIVDGYEDELEKEAAASRLSRLGRIPRRLAIKARRAGRAAKAGGKRYGILLSGGDRDLKDHIHAYANHASKGGKAGFMGRLRQRANAILGRGGFKGDTASIREARKALGVQAATAGAAGLAGYGGYRALRRRRSA